VSCIRVRWLIDDNVFASTMLMYCYVVVAELYSVSGCIILLGIIDKLLIRISNNNIYTFCFVTAKSPEFLYCKLCKTSFHQLIYKGSEADCEVCVYCGLHCTFRYEGRHFLLMLCHSIKFGKVLSSFQVVLPDVCIDTFRNTS